MLFKNVSRRKIFFKNIILLKTSDSKYFLNKIKYPLKTKCIQNVMNHANTWGKLLLLSIHIFNFYTFMQFLYFDQFSKCIVYSRELADPANVFFAIDSNLI